MNYLDIVILAVVGFFTFWGIKKGLTKTLIGVIGFILALSIATGMMGTIAGIMHNLLNINKGAAYILSFLLLFVGVLLICSAIAYIILKTFTITSTRWIDRISGGILGFLIGNLILSTVLVMLSFFSFSEQLMPGKEKSFLYPYAKGFFPGFYNLMVKLKPSSKTFQNITEDILNGQPEEALKRTQAGRDLLKYWEKLKPEKQNENEGNHPQIALRNSESGIQVPASPGQYKEYSGIIIASRALDVII
ncbi:hypothetical protein AMJ80_04270, partial [bacterium SM23_31]